MSGRNVGLLHVGRQAPEALLADGEQAVDDVRQEAARRHVGRAAALEKPHHQGIYRKDRGAADEAGGHIQDSPAVRKEKGALQEAVEEHEEEEPSQEKQNNFPPGS